MKFELAAEVPWDEVTDTETETLQAVSITQVEGEGGMSGLYAPEFHNTNRDTRSGLSVTQLTATFASPQSWVWAVVLKGNWALAGRGKWLQQKLVLLLSRTA